MWYSLSFVLSQDWIKIKCSRHPWWITKKWLKRRMIFHCIMFDFRSPFVFVSLFSCTSHVSFRDIFLFKFLLPQHPMYCHFFPPYFCIFLLLLLYFILVFVFCCCLTVVFCFSRSFNRYLWLTRCPWVVRVQGLRAQKHDKLIQVKVRL